MPKSRLAAKRYDSFQDELRVLNQNLERMNKTLEAIVETIRGRSMRLEASKSPEPMKPLDINAVLSLPRGLRTTAMAIVKLTEGTATVVSGETGRPRAVESNYLNQLVAMGYARKRRVSRKIVFSVER